MAFTYTLSYKPIPHKPTYLKQLMAVSSAVTSFESNATTIRVTSNYEIYPEILSALDQIVPGARPNEEVAEAVIANAIDFGWKLIEEFAGENLVKGITQMGMTRRVRDVTKELTGALIVGSLYDAITACREIDPEDYDAIFVTGPRILQYINKIERYLQIPVSTSI